MEETKIKLIKSLGKLSILIDATESELTVFEDVMKANKELRYRQEFKQALHKALKLLKLIRKEFEGAITPDRQEQLGEASDQLAAMLDDTLRIETDN